MNLRRLPNYLLALVWATMGLYCKVLGFVPRHEQIVAEILGQSIAPAATLWIGLGEIALAIWIVSEIRRKLCATVQMTLIILMNVLELAFAPEHLLWGPANFLFALLFCLFVYWNGFRRFPRSTCSKD